MIKNTFINASICIVYGFALAISQIAVPAEAQNPLVISDEKKLDEFKFRGFFDKLHDLLFTSFFNRNNCKYIPVNFDSSDLPLIQMEIEGNSYPLMLDLGSY